MTEATHSQGSLDAPPGALVDDYDEELLNLPAPVPSPWYAFVTLSVIACSVAILVWFWPDMRYFLRVASDPVDLGDAANVDLNALEHNSYVKLAALPRVNRVVQYTEGTWWFKKDNIRRMFPVAGQRGLLVRWTDDVVMSYAGDVELRPTFPSSFTGRLVRVDKVSFGSRYRSIFAFFKARWDEDLPASSWVLLDKEPPSQAFWVLGVYALFLSFIALNGLKLRRWLQLWRHR